MIQEYYMADIFDRLSIAAFEPFHNHRPHCLAPCIIVFFVVASS